MRLPMILLLGITVLLSASCDRIASLEQRPAPESAGPPQLDPFVTDPGGTGAVRASWLRYAGLPDSGGVPQHALLLQLADGARTGAEAGVRITGLRGLAPPRELGFDFQNGGTCTRDGPRLVLTTSDGRSRAFDCAAGTTVATPGRDGWTRVMFPMPAFPNGITIQDLRVVFLFTGSASRIVIGGFVGITIVVGWPGLHVYVADPGNHRIVRIDNILTGGAYTSLTTFGTLGSGVNQFDWPADVFVDQNSRIYIADRMNDRIVRIDAMTGSGWQTVVGPGTCLNFSLANQMCKPVGVFVDGLGRIYVREYYRRTIRLDGMTGAGLTALGPTPPNNWFVYQDVFLDGAWRIYSSDPFGHRLDRVDDISGAGAISLTFVGGHPFGGKPRGVFVDGSGRIYMADGCHVVRTNDISGSGWTKFPNSTCFESSLTSVALDSYGRIYFTSFFGAYHIWRMNDMSGAGLVRVAAFSSSSLGGIWVDDRGP